MLRLLPGSNDEVRRVVLREITGPPLPSSPSKELLDLISSFELGQKEIPPLRITNQNVLLLITPEGKDVDHENRLNFLACKAAFISMVAIKVVQLSHDKIITNDALLDSLELEDVKAKQALKAQVRYLPDREENPGLPPFDEEEYDDEEPMEEPMEEEEPQP